MKEFVTVRIDLYHQNRFEDMWFGKIYGMTVQEVFDLYEWYNDFYKEDEFDGTWEDWLEDKEVKFDKNVFDVEI